MHREQLFTGFTEPAVAEVGPELGRSPLETYTTQEMPAALRAISEGRMTYKDLAAQQTVLLTEMAPTIAANLDPRVARETQLDLLFMFGGYIPTEDDMYRTSPPALNGLIRQQCGRFEDLKPYMTYEMIVDVNAAAYNRTGVMRVYADGIDGQHERDFYLGHHLAEPFARNAAYNLQALATRPDLYDAGATLTSVRDDLNEFNRFMGSFARLPKESFGYFRQYLAGYADGTRNASGAFMPSVQLLELATMPPTPMYEVYLRESMKYFPAWSRPDMQAWHQASKEGVNIEDQINSRHLRLDDEARATLLEVIDGFIDFRMTHLGITKKQIPAAFSSLKQLTRRHVELQDGEQQILEPEQKGTAGFDVRNVLTNSAYRLLMLQRRLVAGSVGNQDR